MKTKQINYIRELMPLLAEHRLILSKCGKNTIPTYIDDWDICLLAFAVYRNEHYKPRVPLYITAYGLRIQPMHRQWFVSACRKYASLRAMDLLPQGGIGGAIEVTT